MAIDAGDGCFSVGDVSGDVAVGQQSGHVDVLDMGILYAS